MLQKKIKEMTSSERLAYNKLKYRERQAGRQPLQDEFIERIAKRIAQIIKESK